MKTSYAQHPDRWRMGSKTRAKVRVAGRVCESGKLCYESVEAAAVHAEAMMESGLVDPGCHVEPYPCGVCHTFHVGNRFVVFRDVNP